MVDSILTSVKLLVGGIGEDYTYYDEQFLMHINSVFRTLHQLGVGPTDAPFRITDNTSKWSDFIEDDSLDDVKSYVADRVKLLFDPPTNSFLVSEIKDQIKEFEWRLNVAADTGDENNV